MWGWGRSPTLPWGTYATIPGLRSNLLQVISNGVYPGEPKRMEDEYHVNREMVSQTAQKKLELVLKYLVGKTVADLA